MRKIETNATPVLSKTNAKKKWNNFAPTAFVFSNIVSRTNTTLERVRASYWRGTPLALNALDGTAKVVRNC